MSELNLIKTVLFNAASLNEALTRLTELGISYRESQTTDMFCIDSHNIQFWVSRSLRCPLSVFINNEFYDYDDRQSFLAGQQETGETSVPAASPDAGQRPIETFREPADRFDYDQAEREWECHSNSLSTARRVPQPKIPFIEVLRLREILRNERRLKNSHVKGLSS